MQGVATPCSLCSAANCRRCAPGQNAVQRISPYCMPSELPQLHSISRSSIIGDVIVHPLANVAKLDRGFSCIHEMKLYQMGTVCSLRTSTERTRITLVGVARFQRQAEHYNVKILRQMCCSLRDSRMPSRPRRAAICGVVFSWL